jgi:IS30 family transposase
LRPKLCLLAVHEKLQKIVASKLILDWSPEQISGWLKTQYPEDETMRVSHETIYRSLFIQARGVRFDLGAFSLHFSNPRSALPLTRSQASWKRNC